MEKAPAKAASVILSKTKDGCEKAILSVSFKTIVNIVLCVMFSQAGIFSDMYPFGIAFYTSVFHKKSWFILYFISCLSVFVFKTPYPLVHIASLSAITAIMAVFDLTHKLSRGIIASLVFLILKLCYIALSGFVFYKLFALLIETAIVFLSVIIFEKGWSVVSDITKRSYISSLESISAIAFLSLVSLSLASFPAIAGFNSANVFSVLLIFVFSLSGINGEAVSLGVLLGSIGAIKMGDYAAISAGFPLGALMASVFAPFGRIAAVLGFMIANTAAGIITADASQVAVGIYDSLMAAMLFMITPQKICHSVSEVFRKSKSSSGAELKSRRISDSIRERLDEMSQSFRELSQIYGASTINKELGYEYVISKFRQITSSACLACPLKNDCFNKKESKGYRYMAKMLETAFKTGKISPETLPSGFKSRCSRHESFCREFNSVFSVIKTEKMWLAKLNDSRMLISDQLLAVADTISAESEKCTSSIDINLEESIRSEMDKACIFPEELTVERDDCGDFCVSVKFRELKLRSDTLCEISDIIYDLTGKRTNCTSPKRFGETVFYRFYPAHSFTASVGYCSQVKNGEKVSGDSFSFFSSDGQHLNIILSDGMGSGETAQKQSRLTVELMEKFLKAGFKSDAAVRLINSSLLLKSSRDIFSTIDLCTLDLAGGSAGFIKLGAALSYIKTDGKIIAVNSTGLPAGIIREIDVEKHFLSISGDTLILIISDGVADISLKNPSCEGWLEKELTSVDTSNPQIIASRIMKKASALVKNQIHDDMTVVAVSIKKV